MDRKVTSAIVLSISAVLAINWYRRRQRIIKSIGAYPGPPPGFFGRNALKFSSARDILPAFRRLHEQYGDIVKLSTGTASTTLLVADHVFLASSLCFPGYPNMKFKYMSPWSGTDFLPVFGPRCTLHRNGVTRELRDTFLEPFMESVGREAQEMARALYREDGVSFDVFPEISLFTLKIIVETLTGVQLENDNEFMQEYLKCIRPMCQIVTQKAFSPLLQNKAYYRYFCSQLYQEEWKCKKTINNFINYIIEHRDQSTLVLDFLFEARREANASEEDVREELHNLIFFGHQTVALTVSYALFCLARKVTAQDSIYRESRRIFSHRTQLACFKDLKRMKQLSLVINETLRLYPPIPFYLRTLKNDIIVGTTKKDEKLLPKGLTLIINIHGMLRKSTLFYKPDDFDPLDDANDRSFEFNREHGYVPYSLGGIRDCPAKKFSEGLIKTILATIIRHYRIVHANPHYEVDVVPEIVLHPANGVHLRLVTRNPEPELPIVS